ncbi:putative lipooligosaccharide transport system, OM component (LptD family) [Campylobacter pinnipediorum subsp. caledonicus]|uniref:LPS-assembly protein LptD n=1 Tax=Campylobacter pinnipediorum TaxID=1965231 RepID=UPI000994B2B1|nr:LPS assembly protein LptD [Campylobacter pinnipediorum]AQW86424.1 putative lipooligosaccharide transport system, OM component (LptD family) [Campylobacter pinnipediorum subsp. caledonicus]
MYRKIFLCCAVNFSLFAATQNFEFLADNISHEDGVIVADKNVVVYSQAYLITADKAIYDQKNQIVELFGNVNMMKGAGEISRSNYAKLNLKNNDLDLKSLFMMNKDMEIWLKSNQSNSDSKYYTIKQAIVSSCNVNDPDWSISASSTKLNRQSKFLHMFNPVFRIGNVPVFYLPYFGFSIDKHRRSGLLTPEVGYRKKEGIYYKQPIYFAPYDEFDFQLDPQIRTLRGAGLYSGFRFVDSEYSNGAINFGFFNDKESYRRNQINSNSNNSELKNKLHKGIEVEYNRDNLFKNYFDSTLQEGFLLDATVLNDIEYLNLQGKNEDYDSLVTSKLNYYISGDENYFGIYSNYYIDTEKIGNKNGNKDTLQELPSLQYHKFLTDLWIPNILYSVDLQSHRYDRKIGVSAVQNELNIPLSLNIPLFDDYFTFSFYNNFYATSINYNNKTNSRLNKNNDVSEQYVNIEHRFDMHSDVAKTYDNFFHTINYGVEYIVPGYKKGDLSEDFIYDQDSVAYENFLYKQEREQELRMYLTQYLYTSNGRKILKHSISQGKYIKDSEYGDLKNSIFLYPFSNLSLYNKIEYSHTDDKIRTIHSGINYTGNIFSLNLNHTLKNNINFQKDSYLTSSASINLPRYYKLSGSWQYDLQNNKTKMWRAGLNHNRKCWNYNFVYQRDIEPVTTSSGSATKKTDGFYLYVNFYPMGGVHYDFSIEHDSTGNR